MRINRICGTKWQRCFSNYSTIISKGSTDGRMHLRRRVLHSSCRCVKTASSLARRSRAISYHTRVREEWHTHRRESEECIHSFDGPLIAIEGLKSHLDEHVFNELWLDSEWRRVLPLDVLAKEVESRRADNSMTDDLVAYHEARLRSGERDFPLLVTSEKRERASANVFGEPQAPPRVEQQVPPPPPGPPPGREDEPPRPTGEQNTPMNTRI
jgi:hypothetical protein